MIGRLIKILNDRTIEITQSEQQGENRVRRKWTEAQGPLGLPKKKKKERKKEKEKRYNICVTGVSHGKTTRTQLKKYSKK